MGRFSGALKNAVNVGFHGIIEPARSVRRWAKKRFGLMRPVEILPYRGFGDRERIHVIGRVQEVRDTRSARPEDGWWQNARAVVRRFRTSEVPDVGVAVRMDGERVEGRTDREGFFDLELPTPSDLDARAGWHEFDVELTEQVRRGQGGVRNTGAVLVAPPHSTFGVVSDVDDTVIHSHATDFWKLVKLTMLENSRTRVPLAGAAEFYRALHGGHDGARRNPFFYVSSSAWNLYDLILDFLDLHGFPEGPLLLRDIGVGRDMFRSSHAHKVEKVERILSATGELPFLLIGDAGQADPDLYHRIACEFPGRVAAIYIRSVSWLDRSAHVIELSNDLAEKGVEMLLVEDTREAAQHAADRGFIPRAALEEIAVERRIDRAQTLQT